MLLHVGFMVKLGEIDDWMVLFTLVSWNNTYPIQAEDYLELDVLISFFNKFIFAPPLKQMPYNFIYNTSQIFSLSFIIIKN